MADDPIADYLRTLNLPDTVRAMAWDAAYAADDTAAEAGLRKLPKYLNPKVLADLWDLRQGGTLEGEVKTFAPARAEDFPDPAAPQGSAASRFWSNAGKMLNPLTMVSGLYEAVKDRPAIEQTLNNIYDASAAQASLAAEAYRQGDYGEMARRGLATLPVIGPAAAAGGEQIASGDVAGGLGTTVGLMASVAGPTAIKMAGLTKVGTAARSRVADVVRARAIPLARAGVKAPLTLLKQQAGASTAGVNFGADRLAKFLIDNRITTPAQATRIIKNTEAQLQTLLAEKGHLPTDAPSRAQLYLDLLEEQAAKAVKPDHAATIRAVAAEMVNESVLGETLTTTVMRPSPTGVVSAAGDPVMVPVTETSRALRESVPAAEGLGIARATSKWETKRSWGEQKGTAMEATKAQERAVRDAFKVALPEARTPLQRQGQAILAEKVMDRAVWRMANRDQISLPGLVGLSANAVVGFAAHWMRNNQLRLGIYADQLANAIKTNNAAEVAGILSRLGVRLPQLGPLLEQLSAPAPVALPATTAAQGAPPGG